MWVEQDACQLRQLRPRTQRAAVLLRLLDVRILRAVYNSNLSFYIVNIRSNNQFALPGVI